MGIVDSGINAYHDIFQDVHAALPADFIDAATGQPPTPVRLSRAGNFTDRFTADRAIWNGLERGRLYWFEGTRVLGIDLDPNVTKPVIIDRDGHGTWTSSTVRSVSRDAWIVLVQVLEWGPGDDPSKAASNADFVAFGEGIGWLAKQPWVDVVSLSIGLEGNPPLPTWKPYVDATRAGVQSGKAVVVAAGNLPSPTIPAGSGGPPWVISVGGVANSTRGEHPQSGKVVDVVSDFTRRVAGKEPDVYYNRSGTSFATPVVAGVLAEALLRLRTDAHYDGGTVQGSLCPCFGRNITQADLRHALNLTAQYWNTTDYEPLNDAGAVESLIEPTVPILPVAPWAQMGWGYVDPALGPAVASAARGATIPPPKPPGAQAFMDAAEQARSAYWHVMG